MTSIHDARTNIYQRLQSVWGGRPLFFDNTPSEPPDDDVPWARVVVRHAGGMQESLGDANSHVLYGRYGNVVVQLFLPAYTGERLHDELAAKIMRAFETRQSWPVRFSRVTLQEIGPEGRWYRSNLVVRFDYEEIQ